MTTLTDTPPQRPEAPLSTPNSGGVPHVSPGQAAPVPSPQEQTAQTDGPAPAGPPQTVFSGVDVQKAVAAGIDGEFVPELADAVCPQCHSSTPWREASWCPDCGYYPGVSEIAWKDPVPEELVEEEDAPAEERPLLPTWVVQIIAVNSLIVAFAIVARYYFTYFDGSMRGFIAFMMVLIGLGTALTNQVRAGIAAMKKNGEGSLWDAFTSPIEIWRTTLEQLPASGGKLVWALAGITMMLSGQLIVGGIDYAAFFKRDNTVAKKPDFLKEFIASLMAARPKENQPETMEEAMGQFESLAEELEDIQDMVPEEPEPLTCFVYGFMADGSDTFGRLLLGAEIDGEAKHVATINGDDLSENARQKLAFRLSPLITDRTQVSTRYLGATFVHPRVGLNVEFSGWTSSGEMKDAKISFSRPEPPPGSDSESSSGEPGVELPDVELPDIDLPDVDLSPLSDALSG